MEAGPFEGREAFAVETYATRSEQGNQPISKNAASFNPHSNTTFDSNSKPEPARISRS